MEALASSCSREFYPAYHTSGKRKLSDIDWIVWHDEEAASAESAARYFQSKASGGSAHLCVDDNHCFRCLANEDVAWGAAAPQAPGGGVNHQCFHIEMAGFARWSAVVWKSHLNTLRRCAYKTAAHCKQFDLPTEFRYAADLKAGRKGITTHREISKAWGGTHTDPGPFFPISMTMWFVRRYYSQL